VTGSPRAFRFLVVIEAFEAYIQGYFSLGSCLLIFFLFLPLAYVCVYIYIYCVRVCMLLRMLMLLRC
jgi:hypothetical protein